MEKKQCECEDFEGCIHEIHCPNPATDFLIKPMLPVGGNKKLTKDEKFYLCKTCMEYWLS